MQVIERQFYSKERRGSTTSNIIFNQERRRTDKSPIFIDNFFVN